MNCSKWTAYFTIAWLAAAANAGASAHASIISQWMFETSQPLLNNSTTINGILAEVGIGTVSDVHATPTNYSNPSGNGSNDSFTANIWAPGDYYQFSVSTFGFTNIAFSWDQTTSSSGQSQPFKIQADFGSGFTDILNPCFVRDDVWNSITADPDSIFGPIVLGAAAAEKQQSLFARAFAWGTHPPPAATSTVRLDNVTVSGDMIPEPAAWPTEGGCLLLDLAANGGA